MPGALFLGKPPGVLSADHIGGDAGENFGALSYFAPGGFDNNPIACIDSLPGRLTDELGRLVLPIVALSTVRCTRYHSNRANVGDRN